MRRELWWWGCTRRYKGRSRVCFTTSSSPLASLANDAFQVDTTLPALPARLHLTRLLMEFSLHTSALDVLSTIREQDSLLVEGAYLEGWALYLRAEALEADPSRTATSEEEEDMTPPEYYAESMRALLECAKLFAEQDYPDEGIGGHVKDLLEVLEKKGVKPAMGDGEDGADGEDRMGDRGEWEDLEDGDRNVDVEMSS